MANPAAVWNGTHYLVVWESGNQIYGRRVNAQAVRVDGQGAVTGTPIRLGTNHDVWPRVVALGSRWLVVWEQNVSHDDARSTIVGSFVAADGVATAKFSISNGGYDDTPHLAVGSDSGLIVWAEQDIFGRRILPDGQMLDTASGISISNAPEPQWTPAVAWDGTSYIVTYLDHRNAVFPTQQRGDIYGRRVDLNGVVLDMNGFAVANAPVPEEQPAVAALRGSTILVYTAFTTDAPYANLRITLRTLTAGPAITPPSARTNLAARAVSASQVDLQWIDTSDNEGGFKIERCSGMASFCDANSSSYSYLAHVGANVTSYTNAALAPSTSYNYRVRATNSGGDSAYSNTTAVTTQAPPPPPAAPSGLTAAAVSPSQINLQWTDSSMDETGFMIERCSGSVATCDANPAGFSQIVQVAANSTSYSHTGLVAGTTYSYRVRGFSAYGSSAYSNTAAATTPTPPPAAPSNLTATSPSKGQVRLTWVDNATTEQGYLIERSTSATTGFVQIASVGANVTTLTDTGCTSRATYYYRVLATNSGGQSAYSNTVSVRVK